MALNPIQADTFDRMTALVIGPAGIGKTSLLRTLPPDAGVCVLSAEGGLLCVRDLVRSGRVRGYEIHSIADFKDAYNLLATDQAHKNAFPWVFIDSLTELASRCAEAWAAKYPDKSDSFNKWGGYNDEMTALVKDFRDLAPYNVVFTCLESVDKDQDNRRYIAPAVEGKQLKERLTSYFDEVFYYMHLAGQDGNPWRGLLTTAYDQRPAKDRSGRLAPVEPPDLGAIYNKIMAG